MSFSDYIVYVDESGDHGIQNIDPEYPVFVLAFCVFHKQSYAEQIIPRIQKLKFEFWGHDGIVLHSHEIRKAKGAFTILQNEHIRSHFLSSLSALIKDSEFTLIASVINKQRLVHQYAYPSDPYKISLAFCMERLQFFLNEKNQNTAITHIMVERRGKSEDNALELEFRRLRDGTDYIGTMSNLNIVFMDKKHNSAGLQFADLVAHPIGRHQINPEQNNQAYDMVEAKFRRSNAGKIVGFGLKTFP